MLPEDMRDYQAADYDDGFQLLKPEHALIGLLIIMLLVAIFQSV